MRQLHEQKALKEQHNSHVSNNHSLVTMLHQIQETYNYLPEHVLRALAKEKNIPLVDLYRVATFYSLFSLTPKGKHKILTCTGTACHVRGSEKVTEEISRVLGIQPGETTEDGEYSLEAVNCLGACALAPLVVVDEQYHANMTPGQVGSLFNGVKKASCQDEESRHCHCSSLAVGTKEKS